MSVPAELAEARERRVEMAREWLAAKPDPGDLGEVAGHLGAGMSVVKLLLELLEDGEDQPR